MAENEGKKRVASFAVGGGVGFLLGWLLRKKPKAGDVVITDLVAPGSAFRGLPVTISVTVSNTSAEERSAELAVQVANQISSREITLAAGATSVEEFDITLDDVLENYWNVVASVDAMGRRIDYSNPV